MWGCTCVTNPLANVTVPGAMDLPLALACYKVHMCPCSSLSCSQMNHSAPSDEDIPFPNQEHRSTPMQKLGGLVLLGAGLSQQQIPWQDWQQVALQPSVQAFVFCRLPVCLPE